MISTRFRNTSCIKYHRDLAGHNRIKMKRTYSDMTSSLTVLPRLTKDDPANFKSTLDGPLRLQVTKVVDISKPTDKPIEAIDDLLESEEVNRDNILSKGNARMIQLELKDANDLRIRALETEHIVALNNVKTNCLIDINGPIDLRCGNLMLERKHNIRVEKGPEAVVQEVPEASWPSDEEDDLIITDPPPATLSASTSERTVIYATPVMASSSVEKSSTSEPVPVQVVHLEEDWDEEDESDCIILD